MITDKQNTIVFDQRNGKYLSDKKTDEYVWVITAGGRPSYLFFVNAETGEFIGFWSACPMCICLSGDTEIDTPNGSVDVKDLKKGMPVWTSDNYGRKELATILDTKKVTVSPPHMMIHIVLGDGRELFASPGHPTVDGRLLGKLSVGDILDNSSVKSVEYVRYNENYTYDILPSGPTGFYWANGILVGSTLK